MTGWTLIYLTMSNVWDYYETRSRPFWVNPLFVYAAKRASPVPEL